MKYFYHFDEEYMASFEKELQSQVKTKLISQVDADHKLSDKKKMREAYKVESWVGRTGIVKVTRYQSKIDEHYNASLIQVIEERMATVVEDIDLRSILVAVENSVYSEAIYNSEEQKSYSNRMPISREDFKLVP